MNFKYLVLLSLVLLSVNLKGQEVFKDTLKLSLQQADSVFISRNLSLLAEKCNINAAKAQIIQSGLFTNITISATQNVINNEYKAMGVRKWFDTSDKGESSAQIQKLFRLAGKRNKQIQLAELTAGKEEQIYFDLMRTLKYTLRSDFYNLYYLSQIVKVYDKEIASMHKLIDAYQGQFEKGFISKKELLRLKSSLFSLENEKIGFTTQIIATQNDFNMIMHTSNIFYSPLVDLGFLSKFTPDQLKLQVLMDTAYVHRYDLKMAQSDVKINEVNLSYQRSMAVPDLTLSAGWDKNGGYIHNYNFIGMQIDLPFFNRNQGNIKSAKYMIESSKYKLLSAEDMVKSDVLGAYANLKETNQLYNKFDNSFMADLDLLSQEMLKNFEKKNISLIEFLDYYDAYKQNAVQLNTLLYNRINAVENLSFTIGKDIITQ
ncbi:MAG: TolC family protein [Mariniphaga sp.]